MRVIFLVILVSSVLLTNHAITSAVGQNQREEGMDCDTCINAGNVWCTGEANCNISASVVLPSSSSSSILICANFINSTTARCIPTPIYGDDSTCANSTCAQLYGSKHMECNSIGSCDCTAHYSKKPWHGETEQSMMSNNKNTSNAVASCSYCAESAYPIISFNNDENNDESLHCVSCVVDSFITISIIVLFLIIAFLTFCLVLLNSHTVQARLFAPIRMMIIQFQLIGMIYTVYTLQWPKIIQQLFHVTNWLGLNFQFPITARDCLFTPPVQLWITLIIPIIVIAILFFVYVFILFIESIRVHRSTIDSHQLVATAIHYRILFVSTFLYFLTLFYSILCQTIVQTWKGTLWHVEMDQLIGVIVGSLMYIIGIPLLLIMLTVPSNRFRANCRHCCRCLCRTQEQYQTAVWTLVEPYRTANSDNHNNNPMQLWQSVFDCVWKLVLNITIIFASSSSSSLVQMIVILCIFCVLILCYAFIQPYSIKFYNSLQCVLLVCATVIYSTGIMYQRATTTTEEHKLLQIIASIIFTIAMIGMISCMIYLLVRSIKYGSVADESMMSERANANPRRLRPSGSRAAVASLSSSRAYDHGGTASLNSGAHRYESSVGSDPLSPDFIARPLSALHESLLFTPDTRRSGGDDQAHHISGSSSSHDEYYTNSSRSHQEAEMSITKSGSKDGLLAQLDRSS